MNSDFIKSPRGILHLASFLAFAAGAISIAFITSEWAFVILSGTAYYCIIANAIGACFSMGVILYIGFRPTENLLQLKMLIISANIIFAIVATSVAIIYAINAHDAFKFSSFGFTVLRGGAFAAGSAFDFIAAFLCGANGYFWSQI